MPKHSLSRLMFDLRWFFSILIIVSVVLTILSVISYDNFIVDLSSNFPIQFCLIGIIGLIVFALRNQWGFVFLSLILIGINVAEIIPYIKTSKINNHSVNNVRIMVANLHSSNTDYEEVVDLVKSISPVVVTFLEVNNAWQTHLSQLNELLPFSKSISREDNFGISIFSSFPLLDVKVEPFESGQPPSIQARLKIDDREINIIATHPVPPIGSNGFQYRNSQLASLARLVRDLRHNVVVMGDLNTTVWAPSFKSFINRSELINPRLSFGVLPTWPKQLPLFYIPIDHILTSRDIIVSKLEVFPISGSDHRAIIADILIEKTTN